MDTGTDVQMSRLTDEQIVDLYLHRDENAIRATEAKYGRMLFHIAYNILHDAAACEECQNDTYLCVWNRIPPTRPKVFSAFISKTMRDVAINAYKRASVKKRIPSEMTVSIESLYESLHDEDTADAAYTAKELGKLISEYVRGLPERRHNAHRAGPSHALVGPVGQGCSVRLPCDEYDAVCRISNAKPSLPGRCEHTSRRYRYA